jgi:ABC-2 type transport system ATP-binding protein
VVVGRGTVIADTTVADLLAAAAGDRVTLRTTARADAMAVLARAGAAVTSAGDDSVTVCGLPAGKIVTVLGTAAVPFSEVSAHRASLEEAYLELTRDAVEFRAASGKEMAR